MSEAEPLLNAQEIEDKMVSLRENAMKRNVNAYVDHLANLRRKTDEKMNQITIILVVLSSVSIFFSVLILEISWSDGAYRHDNFGIEFCKLIVSGLTIATWLALWSKYKILASNVAPKLWNEKKKQVQSEGKHEPDIEDDDCTKYTQGCRECIQWNQYQSGLTFAAEIFFSTLHCPPAASPFYAPLGLFRAYHFFALLRWIPFIKDMRKKQIQSGNVASQSNWSIMKIWLRFHPWLSVIGFISLFLPILSYSVYAVERADDESDIDNYGTAIWLTTWMLFVGEAYTPTHAGRLPALLCGMSSIVVSTLVFVGLLRTLEIDSQEEAITTGKLESQLHIKVRKSAAVYAFWKWKSYKRNKKYEEPVKEKLSQLKKKWREAKCELNNVQQKRPAGAASVVVQIQELVRDTATTIDNFQLSTLGKLAEMETQCDNINIKSRSVDQKNDPIVERLLQTYTNLQQNSENDIKKITEKMDSFTEKTERSIEEVQSKNSNVQRDALDSLKQTSIKLGEQFKAIINKQALQREELKQAKMEIQGTRELQKQQLDMCERLRKEIKELAEMQRTLITSNLETHSKQVIDKINKEMGSPSSKRGR